MEFEEIPQRIISDFSKLDFDYVPEELIHRESQTKRLFSIFKPVVEVGGSQRTLLNGGVGTGKSALSKRFCLDFKEWAAKKGRYVDFVVVNCRSRNTPSSVLLKTLNKFQPNFPDRGFSTAEMLEILRKDIDKNDVHLIIVLDEVDVLIKKSGSDLLYSFSRFSDESVIGSKGHISLILVSQKRVHEFLDAATLSTIKRTNQVSFERYNKVELRDIVQQRVDLAFFPGTILEETVEFIADISAEFGDARFAIELLENSGRIANEENSDLVNAEHVRAAKAMTYSVVTESKLVSLDEHMLLTLLAVSRTVRDRAFVTTGEVEETYALVCEEYNTNPRAHTQFWDYLKSLGDLGLLGLNASGKGMVGKTTLISLPDIPARVLEEKLKNIIK